MKLVRWDPFRDLVAMSQRLNRLPDDPYNLGAGDPLGWAPPVDIFEKQDQLIIRAEVPGVQRSDLDVRIENGVLTLHGERKQETDVAEGNAHVTERSYGSFTRSFSLPTTVDAGRIAASYKDGVLEVTVPKAETAKSKKVEIKAA
jgi:HSP20 family protein